MNTKTVYMVTNGECDDFYVHGIFSNKEAAEKFCADLKAQPYCYSDYVVAETALSDSWDDPRIQ